jgi:serine/threonine protein kinase
LGQGTFGIVYRGVHRHAGTDASANWKNVAIKKMKPNKLDTKNGRRRIETYNDLERYCAEIKILLHLRRDSPRSSKVLHMFEYFMIRQNVYIVTELLGQDLETWRKEIGDFREHMAVTICRSILISIRYLSKKEVVHRDIKLQNIMFQSAGDFESLKLVDFGLACRLTKNEFANECCGSVGYIAPEVYSRKDYRFEVDMFSFGVLLFRLLSGDRPFPNTNSRVLERDTQECRYNVTTSAWSNVSDDAKDLVRKLIVHREERLTVEQALLHPWFFSHGQSILSADNSQQRRQSRRSRAFVRVSTYCWDDPCWYSVGLYFASNVVGFCWR